MVRLCDFHVCDGRRVHLDALPGAPLACLRAGARQNRVTLDVTQALLLRDALNRFIGAVDVCDPHGSGYVQQLGAL